MKRQIGKEVYEDYLFSIIKGSKLFDEVIPEQDYHYKKNEAKTVDVMCRKGNAYSQKNSFNGFFQFSRKTFNQRRSRTLFRYSVKMHCVY